MATINDGGPAFPVLTCTLRTSESEMLHAGHMGLSLRDYFAARALSCFLADADYSPADKPECVAEAVYKIADAMLATRTPEPSA